MQASPFQVTRLRCEYLEQPLGIDERSPRLSWNLECERRGVRQSAWRVLVSSSSDRLARGEGDLWDSGRVASGETVNIPYAGRSLVSRQSCHWLVDSWDETEAHARSAPARWTMGLLNPGDWSARWIAADPGIYSSPSPARSPGADDLEAAAPTADRPGAPGYFRREFELRTAPRRATLYATARGVFELRLNGRRIGEDIFAPEWTDYDRRIQYRAYEVADHLHAGANALGAILGDGWWSGFVGWQEKRGRYGLENSLLLQLEIEEESGTRLIVGTDPSWRCATGPVRQSDFMLGETYDARREQSGWDQPGFRPATSDFAGLPARETAAPPALLVAQRSQPVRITQEIPPVSVRRIAPGRWIFDLGQNIAGWVRLRIAAAAGTRLRLRHAERLNPDGTLYTDNLRRAHATDVYICRGGGEEIWEPRFTFHGFQYVELDGLADTDPESLPPGIVTGCVIHSAFPGAGSFECSNAEVNRLWLNGAWSQRGNSISVPTDCPQRDERLGWTGDAQVFLRTAAYNFDVAAFYSKWMVDVEDAQTPEGIFPDTAPRLREGKDFVGLGGLGGAAGWADAGIIVPWTIWQIHNDRRIIERHWPSMAAWLAYLERTNPNGIRDRELGNNYGDWLCLPSDTRFGIPSPMKTLLATAFWADDAAKMAQMAGAVGKTAEAERFAATFDRVRRAFQKEFLGGHGLLTVETQTAYLLALAVDLLPTDQRRAAAQRLVDLIESEGGHLSTGFIGIRYLNPILTLAGRADVAYSLLLRDDFPSWLYPIRHGATTIWERWNGWTAESGFFDPTMNSFNHYSLGSIGEWLFRQVAGIELAAEYPGFGQFVLHPYPDRRLAFARASYRCPHGEIVSAWEWRKNAFRWKVRIPPNTVAKVYIPSDSGATITEGGALLEQAASLRIISRQSSLVVCEVAAGSYAFASTYSADQTRVSSNFLNE